MSKSSLLFNCKRDDFSLISLDWMRIFLFTSFEKCLYFSRQWYSPFLHYLLVPSLHKINIGNTGAFLYRNELPEWTFICVLEYFSFVFFSTNLPRMYTYSDMFENHVV